jgi:L-lactate dehydrogenase complex protein LldG
VVEGARDVMSTDTVARFLAAVTEQSCTTSGPVAADLAAAHVAQRCAAFAAGGLVAVSDTDPVMHSGALLDALDAAGVAVLAPDDPDWRTRIPTAAVGVTIGGVAVADLGVVAVFTDVGRPRSVSLLPETHVCVVADDDVVETFADALARVAAAPLPSALLWIGGPSRTGDLEMITTLGVHGPRAVEMVVVDTST